MTGIYFILIKTKVVLQLVEHRLYLVIGYQVFTTDCYYYPHIAIDYTKAMTDLMSDK